MSDLEHKIVMYRDVEQEHDAIKSTLTAARAKFEVEHKVILDTEKALRELLSVAADNLRATAVAEYEETGEKHLCMGMGVRVTPELTYDGGLALEWAKEHGLALCLDKKSFESIVKTDPKQFPFVMIDNNPKATIPKEWKE